MGVKWYCLGVSRTISTRSQDQEMVGLSRTNPCDYLEETRNATLWTPVNLAYRLPSCQVSAPI